MPEYHGDVMHKMGNIYTRSDDRNYPVVMMLAVMFGPIGIHRFFLNDMAIAFCYFWPFAISMLMGAAMLDFTLALWVVGIAYVFVFMELVYFAYCWSKR